MNDIPNAIIRAAEARAMGKSWDAAAEAAGWELRGLKHWIKTHPRDWARAEGRARQDVRNAACDEAVSMLRQQLRSKKEKTVLDAAKAITARFSQRKAKPRSPTPSNTASQFLDQLADIPEGRATRVDQHLQAAEDEASANRKRDRQRSR